MIGHEFPYLDTRDLNLDWLLKNMKQLIQDWATYQQNMNQSFSDLNAAFVALQTWVNSYFDNLDVQQEINNKLDDMRTSGELAEIMNPLIATEAGAWLAEHITNPSNPPIDTSLSVSNAAADAKVTGDNLKSLAVALDTTADAVIMGELVLHPSFTTGTAIKTADGTVMEFSGVTTWASTDYIMIPPETDKIRSNAASLSTAYGYAIYDIDHNFITSGGNYAGFSIDVQDSYKYIRFTSYAADSDHSAVTLEIVGEYPGIKGLSDDLDYLVAGSEVHTNITMTSEGAISATDGSIVSFPGYPNYRYSDFIPIPDYTKTVSFIATVEGTTVGAAFYDDDKHYIAGSSKVNYASPTYEVQDTYKYIRFTDGRAGNPQVDITFIPKLDASGIYSTAGTFSDAVASGKLLKGTYTLNGVVTLSEGQNLIGSGCTVNVGDSGQIRMSNGSKISGIKFVGSWNPTREPGDGETYTSYGYVPLIDYTDLYDGDTDALFGEGKSTADAVLYIPNNAAYNVIVEGCRFENFDRLAIYAGGGRHQDKTNPVICNNYFSDCRMGVYIYGEFIRAYANEFLRCIVGTCLLGGNSNNFGEIYKCCDVGFYFPVNAVAHNEITSCETAHCGLAGIYLRFLSKALGCVVNGCHFPDAPIIGADVSNLYITGSLLSTYVEYTTGKHNAITCCNIRRNATYLYGHDVFDVPEDTLITLNRAMDDDTDANVNWPVS